MGQFNGLTPCPASQSNPSKAWCQRLRTTGPGIAAFDGTPFIVGLSAPDSVLLAGLHRPVQAGLGDFAAVADSSCLFDLEKCRAGIPDGEEQLGVLFQAGSGVTSGHQGQAPLIRVWAACPWPRHRRTWPRGGPPPRLEASVPRLRHRPVRPDCRSSGCVWVLERRH
jgi:hypothetical protein